jgi:hydrogenase maturation factor
VRPGKLPPDLLARLVGSATWPDPRVLVGPGIGEDAAGIDLGDGRVLVLKSDPITFAGDLIGWYAVHVNANDVATMGATPQFFLATLLLPESFKEDAVAPIFEQIGEACRSIGAVLVGGHTEVTHGIEGPILCGAMVGEVARDRLVRSSGARAGDALLLTGGIAIEGTAVLARDVPGDLRAAGVGEATIERAARFLWEPGISVLPDARALLDAVPVHAMHDPTEGGLRAAVHELALASGLGAVLEAGMIPVLPETREVATALRLDPLGMLASGALLAAVPDDVVEKARTALSAAGIDSAVIGELREGAGVVLRSAEAESALPMEAQDEVARYLAERKREQAGQ